MGKNLKHADELLRQIAEQLRELPLRTPLSCVEVVFYTDLRDGCSEAFEFSLDAALDAIALDLYWDDRGNWADARRAVVRVI